MAIKINLASLGEGSELFDFIAGPKELGLDDNLIKDKLFITADVFKVSNQVDMRINIKGKFRLACDMCLDEFEKPFEKEFELVYVQKSQREEILDNDYIKTYNPFMKTIDITEDVREYTLLAVPMKKLPEENTDGTCSWCGKTKEYWNSYIKKEEQ
jgi:uncharacterized metal-binding protein YceD (DUF177 family)